MKQIIYSLVNYFKVIFFLLSILLSLVVIDNLASKSHAVSSNIIINEFLYDPIDSDLGKEWIELYNISNTPVDLNGWKVQIAGTEFKDAVTIANVGQNTLVESNSYYLICERQVFNCQYYVDKIAMQNGGSESDGVRIVDSKGYVIDSAIYDSPNANNLVDDTGGPTSNPFAKEIVSGNSIGRLHYVDTDSSNLDMHIFEIPTPGGDNKIDGELENTGDNILLLLLPFPIFILLLYSGTLFKIIKLIKLK